MLIITPKILDPTTGGPTITGVFVNHTIARVVQKYYAINCGLSGDGNKFPTRWANVTTSIPFQSWEPGEQIVQTTFSIRSLCLRVAGLQKSVRTVSLWRGCVCSAHACALLLSWAPQCSQHEAWKGSHERGSKKGLFLMVLYPLHRWPCGRCASLLMGNRSETWVDVKNECATQKQVIAESYRLI